MSIHPWNPAAWTRRIPHPAQSWVRHGSPSFHLQVWRHNALQRPNTSTRCDRRTTNVEAFREKQNFSLGYLFVYLFLLLVVDFHAYRGYEYTHKRGIEADQTRITGVSITHNLGRFLPQFLTLQRLTPSPVSLYYSYNF